MPKRRKPSGARGTNDAPKDAPAIEEAKARVSAGLLGREGVHAVGLRREERTIVLYVAAIDDCGRARLRERAAELAAPFAIDLIESERARGIDPRGA